MTAHLPGRAFFLLLALCLPVLVSAQVTTTGRLAGVVTDSRGALVPGAEIVVTQNETRSEYKATTNHEGGWSIPSVSS